MNATTLFMGMIFGSIGMGYFIYGKKQRHAIALMSGIVLCVIPYFISNIIFIIFIGVGLMALPFLIKQ